MKKTLDTSAREDLGDDFKKALDEGWLPIREVARLTGVNAVTLRAWERRYGLIVPQRTPKGHRLFSADHVQRIQAILTWLNRGVAVSQVKELLDTPQIFSESVDNDWHTLQLTLLQAVSGLQERALDDNVNQAMALYPPRTANPVRAIADAIAGRSGAALARPIRCTDGTGLFLCLATQQIRRTHLP